MEKIYTPSKDDFLHDARTGVAALFDFSDCTNEITPEMTMTTTSIMKVAQLGLSEKMTSAK